MYILILLEHTLEEEELFARMHRKAWTHRDCGDWQGLDLKENVSDS